MAMAQEGRNPDLTARVAVVNLKDFAAVLEIFSGFGIGVQTVKRSFIKIVKAILANVG